MCFGNWNADKQCGTTLGSRFDLEVTADDTETFLNSEQAQAAATISRLGRHASIESPPVIFNNCLNLFFSAAEDKSHARCTRMLCDIVKRFLNDPVKNRFNLGRDAGSFVLSRLEIHVDAVARGPGFDQRTNRFHKSEIIKGSRPQFHCHAVKIARGLCGQLLKVLHSTAETRA